MEASTQIKQMFSGNTIFVPNYQRAYSWDTEFDPTKMPKQVNTFLSDLEEYSQSVTTSKYYFGHFLFEDKKNNNFGVIDGQQRLTTIVIFLSALFTCLKSKRLLTELEDVAYEDVIKRKSKYRFETVDYDNLFLQDYVINQTKKDRTGLQTESAKRIADAFDLFQANFKDRDEAYLLKMLGVVLEASCTTHPVVDESEAIQMFIFQNNRGKKPSDLEIIKAQFMFNIHLHGGDEKESLIKEIKERFERIYKSIASIEYAITEDDVLTYTARVYFNSLWESNINEKIEKILSGKNSIHFIKSFTQSLAASFEYLTKFFGEGQRNHFEIHSLVSLGGIGVSIPFIIKTYNFGLEGELPVLCSKFESLIIRQRLVGTRADLVSRLNDAYQSFEETNKNIQPIFEIIDRVKKADSEDYWWAYWNNEELEKSLRGEIGHTKAKFLLWKYENYLKLQGNSGYYPTRFSDIQSPELEHIAPVTQNPQSGYDNYDEDFKKNCINSLGNYLLISKSHNCSIGNKPFAEKRATYRHLLQHQEIQDLTKDQPMWTRDLIANRKEKIIKVIMQMYR